MIPTTWIVAAVGGLLLTGAAAYGWSHGAMENPMGPGQHAMAGHGDCQGHHGDHHRMQHDGPMHDGDGCPHDHMGQGGHHGSMGIHR